MLNNIDGKTKPLTIMAIFDFGLMLRWTYCISYHKPSMFSSMGIFLNSYLVYLTSRECRWRRVVRIWPFGKATEELIHEASTEHPFRPGEHGWFEGPIRNICKKCKIERMRAICIIWMPIYFCFLEVVSKNCKFSAGFYTFCFLTLPAISVVKRTESLKVFWIWIKLIFFLKFSFQWCELKITYQVSKN